MPARTPRPAIPARGFDGWDDYAAFYDWENARTIGRRDVAFWQRQARRVGAPILELGCGTGRLLMPMARAGGRLIGVDRSAAMLAAADRRLRRLPRQRRPTLVRGDIRTLPCRTASIGLVAAPYGVLQSLLEDHDLAAAVTEAARVLKPGGRFVVDLVPDLLAWPEYTSRTRLRGPSTGGRQVTLVESVRQDRPRQVTVFDEEFIERRGRQTSRHRFSLAFRTPTAADLAATLDRAGLDVETVEGDYGGGRWAEGADTWLILARKRADRR